MKKRVFGRWRARWPLERERAPGQPETLQLPPIGQRCLGDWVSVFHKCFARFVRCRTVTTGDFRLDSRKRGQSEVRAWLMPLSVSPIRGSPGRRRPTGMGTIASSVFRTSAPRARLLNCGPAASSSAHGFAAAPRVMPASTGGPPGPRRPTPHPSCAAGSCSVSAPMFDGWTYSAARCRWRPGTMVRMTSSAE